MRVPIDGIAESTTLSVLLRFVFTPPSCCPNKSPEAEKNCQQDHGEFVYTITMGIVLAP
jgi:hypothetical protein